ncbi:MAG: hypothetical protein KF746_23300 [Chitinophagaceae bacterium]|nr:hypothetical protein [Chitinophagaceae bacterium]
MSISQQINLPVSFILLSDSFDEGRYNKPWSGGNWDDLQRGRNERDWSNRTTQGNISNGKTNWGGGAGGGNVLGWIIALVILIPIVVTSAVSSLLIAVILKLYIRNVEPESLELTFGKAFSLLFKATLLYQVLNGVIFLIIYFLLKQNMEIPFLNLEALNQSDIYKTIFTSLLLYQIPTILITGIILRSKLSDSLKFKGFSGYLRATLFTALVIMPLILAISYVVMDAISFYVYKQPNYIFH